MSTRLGRHLTPEFSRPTTLDEALAQLAGPEALAVGGATQVALLLKHGLVEPRRLVWLGGVRELCGITLEPDGALVLGATTTLAELATAPAVRAVYPAIAAAAAEVGNTRVRAVATLGGHLAHADPRQDLPPILLVLGAVVTIRGLRGERRVALRDFFRGPFETAIGESELLTLIRVPPVSPGARFGYVRFAPQSAMDYPTVGVAAYLERENGRVGRMAVGLGGVDGRPLLVEFPQLAGRPATRETFEAAGAVAASRCSPVSDQRGSMRYKQTMASLWTSRVLIDLI